MSMRETLAMAICTMTRGEKPWAQLTNHEKFAYRISAAGALEAIREPTDGLIAAACASHEPRQPMSRRTPHECPSFEAARQRWREQINAILEGRA